MPIHHPTIGLFVCAMDENTKREDLKLTRRATCLPIRIGLSQNVLHNQINGHF